MTTKYGGGFVQSVDGRSGGTQGGRPYDWFFYVNGVLSPRGAAQVQVGKGDRIWWDRHDWGAVQDIPAVVGSFPAPFSTGGIDDKRLPIRVECTIPGAAYCRAARQRFADIGLTAASGGLQGSQTAETTRVLVGTFDQLAVDDTAALLEGGPRRSGVYLRFAVDGRSLQTLDARGRPVRTLGAGTGVVAAVRQEANQVTWIFTGTDQRGLDAAIAAVGERTLARKFAAVTTGGRVVGVPEAPAR